ncbi:MAG TPA: hypothetical protein VFQ17_03635, partial [Nocardioides sp.]|nr:hypothetical protein [Nocardioides sp.]
MTAYVQDPGTTPLPGLDEALLQDAVDVCLPPPQIRAPHGLDDPAFSLYQREALVVVLDLLGRAVPL